MALKAENKSALKVPEDKVLEKLLLDLYQNISRVDRVDFLPWEDFPLEKWASKSVAILKDNFLSKITSEEIEVMRKYVKSVKSEEKKEDEDDLSELIYEQQDPLFKSLYGLGQMMFVFRRIAQAESVLSYAPLQEELNEAIKELWKLLF